MDAMSKKPIDVDWNAGGMSGIVRFESDKNLLVVFYTRAVRDPLASQKAGRPICEDQVYVKIQHPGENYNIIDRPVQDQDKLRFPSQWTSYIRNQAQVVEGTPIDLLFPNYPAVAENLRAYGIQTIEQCANLSAHAIQTIGMGGQEYSNRAKKYLEGAGTGAAFHTIQKELNDAKSQNRVLQDQLGKLKSQMDALMARDINPHGASLNPPFIKGYDAQSERINANHATKEIAEQAAPVQARRGIKRITAQEAALEAKDLDAAT
jgi:hypothetical protein